MDQQKYTTLVEVFSQVPDPRKRQGKRHRWITLLTLIAAALASAQRTPQEISRWVHSRRTQLFAVLPPTVSRLPSGATIRRALAQLDVAALETALSAFHPPSTPPAATSPSPLASPAPLQGLAIDGKAIRAVGRAGHPCHLVSLLQHGDASVLAQVEVERKRDERSAVPALLADRDLSGKVVTLDALHTLRPTARLIRAQNGHFLMIVKKNQASLYEYLDMLFTLPAHPADREVWDSYGPKTRFQKGQSDFTL